MPVKVIIS